MKTSLVLCMLLVGCMAFPADLVTKSGKIYKDYEIYGVNERGVAISNSTCDTTIQLADLPDELCEKYAPQVEAAKQKTAKQCEQNMLAENMKQITLDLEGETICVQVLQGTVLAEHGAYENKFYIEDVSTSGIADGSLLPYNATGTVHDWDAIFNNGKNGATKQGPVVRIYCIGTFTYRTAGGYSATIPKFTMNREKAIEYLKSHPNATINGMQKTQEAGESESDIRRRMNQDNKLRNQKFRSQ